MSLALVEDHVLEEFRDQAAGVDGSDRQLYGDIDLSQLVLDPARHGVRGFNVVDSIVDANAERTIEAASKVTISVHDPDRKLLRSGLLEEVIDIEIDGLWFRLAHTRKQEDELALEFEDREVAILRTYDKPRKARRGRVTRAQFARALVREARPRIRFFSPEANERQPVGKAKRREKGIMNDPDLTVQGVRATREQRRNMETVLDVGTEMNVSRKILLAALITIIQESWAKNLAGGDLDSVGIFQQRRSQGWPASRNVRTDAKAFYEHAVTQERKFPGNSEAGLAQAVQHSGRPTSTYERWLPEARKALAAYGGPNRRSHDHPYEFSRGQPGQRENTWDCLLRLADEVNWRRFVVAGVVYFVSETYLIASKPRMRVSEDTPGVDVIDFDFDPRKKSQTATVRCHIGRWAAPPGSVVVVSESGPANGRWLVSSIRRSLYSSVGEITLRRPRPKLDEPAAESSSSSSSSSSSTGGYVNPFADAQLQPGRIDQGVDYHGTGPIKAIGKALIIGNGGGGWPGGNYLLYKLLDGQHEGRYVYVAEAIKPTVRKGQRVEAGAQIATFGPGAAPGKFPGIETGWSSATLNVTRAAELGNTGGPGHDNAPAGLAFARFMRSLGVDQAADPGSGPHYI